MEKRGINKRGISPFIAAVILIIVAVAIGVIVANFIRGYVGGTLDDASRQSVRGMSCSVDVNFQIYEINRVKQIFNDETTLTVMLNNIGRTKIENFSITIITDDDVIQGVINATSGSNSLDVGGIKRYSYTHNLGENLNSVSITPIIRQDAVLAECVNIVAETNQFGVASITVTPGPSPCPLPWNESITIAHLDDVTAYENPTVPFGSECVNETRVCDNGELNGTFVNEECEVEDYQMPQSSNLVGYWKFEGNFEDSSENENHGTNHGVTFVESPIAGGGYAGSFSGSDYIDCGNDQSLNFGTGDFTISVWFNPTNLGSNWEGLINKAGAFPHQGPQLFVRNTGLLIHTYVGYHMQPSYSFQNEMWYHIIVLRTGSNVRAYLNNNYVGDYYDSNNQDNSYSFTIGARPTGADAFEGLIDEVVAWDVALTENEIDDIYQNTKPE